jgi:hypothetical protein
MQLSDSTRDCRGWFYRALAPDQASAVLEIGEGFAANWLPNVTRSSLMPGPAQTPTAFFDMVVLHNTLGGCRTLREAVRVAAAALRPGGLLIVAGENQLRAGAGPSSPSTRRPRASGWGFRNLLRHAGFDKIVLYAVHPDVDTPLHVIDAHPRSARDFFGNVLRSRAATRWSLKTVAMRALVRFNLMPYLQPHFIVVGRKC